MSGREPTFCPQCGPDVEIDDEGCCRTCGNGATGGAAELFARLQAVLDAVREEHLGCEGRRAAGLKAHPCKVCDAIRAMDGEVKP